MIKQAAIKIGNDIHTLPRPARHHDIIRALATEILLPTPIGGTQGFILDDGTFVNRVDALNVAIKSGQVKLENCHAPKTGLFSEDLW